MIRLLVAVEAKPGPAVVFESAQPIEGYYQTFGVSAGNEGEARKLIVRHLHEDLESELVEISDEWVPDFDGADSDIRDEVGDANQAGIWYVSGRAWFGPDDN